MVYPQLSPTPVNSRQVNLSFVKFGNPGRAGFPCLYTNILRFLFKTICAKVTSKESYKYVYDMIDADVL